MAKKIIRLEIVAEMEVNTDWYDDSSDESIMEHEKNSWIEWIGEKYISEKITIHEKK